MALLLEDVSALVPPVADRAAFSDLGAGWLELLIVGADKGRLAAWLARALADGRATAVARSAEALVVSRAELPGPVEHDEYVQELLLLSGRALAILRAHPAGPVPGALVAAEVLALHRRRGDMERSIAWQITWLDPRAENPGRPPTVAVGLTARLAHGHWLRLTGGVPDRHAEVGMLESYR
jgi:hypothetical protein